MVTKFHVGIPNQVTAISKICENDLKELEPLKYICNVRMGNRVYESELTEGQKQLLERLGVTENDVRRIENLLFEAVVSENNLSVSKIDKMEE